MQRGHRASLEHGWADSETFAHLEHLRFAREFERPVAAGPYRDAAARRTLVDDARSRELPRIAYQITSFSPLWLDGHRTATEPEDTMTLIDLYLTEPDPDDGWPVIAADADEAGTVETVVTDDGSDDPVGSTFARCADGSGTLTHLFFSDDEFDIARAKAICGKCGLAETCLSGALDRAEPYGVWGGELVIEGVVVAVKRGRGRPPKVPRPALVVDEVPIPPHLVA
jgi:WhiB family redox-sensing transcriptional regulator